MKKQKERKEIKIAESSFMNHDECNMTDGWFVNNVFNRSLMKMNCDLIQKAMFRFLVTIF